MSQADFTEMVGSLTTAEVARGVTSGIARPPGGGAFVYGMNSLGVVNGAVGLFVNQVNFAPTPINKGGSVRAAVQRGPSGGLTNFSPAIFAGLSGTGVSDPAYLLGLSDEEPGHIVLVKGALEDGVPASPPGTDGVLRRSTTSYPAGTWVHLRLDMAVNTNGDVVLTAWVNDLTVNDVATPAWTRVPGFADSVNPVYDFLDDVLQVNSGTPPLLNGRLGWGGRFADVQRRCYFDHVEILRQV